MDHQRGGFRPVTRRPVKTAAKTREKRKYPPLDPPKANIRPAPFWETDLCAPLRAGCWTWERLGGQTPDEGRLPILGLGEGVPKSGKKYYWKEVAGKIGRENEKRYTIVKSTR